MFGDGWPSQQEEALIAGQLQTPGCNGVTAKQKVCQQIVDSTYIVVGL